MTRVLLVLVLVLATCGGEPVAPEPPPLRTVELAATDTLRARVTVPAQWPCEDRGCFVRNSWGEAVVGIELGAGSPANLRTTIVNVADVERRPNVGTGDPALDAVRLDVAVVEHGEDPDGAYIIVRVTKPRGLEGPYRERLVARCARMVPSGDRFIYANAWTALELEPFHGQALLTACKTLQP